MNRDRQPQMVAPRDAVREHFVSSLPEEVVQRAQQLLLYGDLPDSVDDEHVAEGPALAHPRVHRVPLRAYLACALTGLTVDQRNNTVFDLSDRVNRICLEIDIELYEPRKKTDPAHSADMS